MSELVNEPLAPAPEAPAPEAEESWVPSREEWEQTQQALYDLTQQVAPPPQRETGYPSIDPFADDYPQQLAGFVTQSVQQAIQPLMEWQQGQQLGEAEERALDILDDITSRDGEFLAKEQAYEASRALAGVFVNEEAEKHGWGPKAAEAALQRAAKFVRDYEQAVGKAYYDRQINQFSTIAGADREPPAGGVGSQQIVTERGGDELSLVQKYGGFAPGRG